VLFCYQTCKDPCGTVAPGNLQAFPCQDLNLGPVTVHLLRKNRRSGFFGIHAFLGLAICVFSWGLQYKLSLYDPPQAVSHQFPTAKLLSKNEQSRATDSPRVVRTRTSAKVIYTAPKHSPPILASFHFLVLASVRPKTEARERLVASTPRLLEHTLCAPSASSRLATPLVVKTAASALVDWRAAAWHSLYR